MNNAAALPATAYYLPGNETNQCFPMPPKVTEEAADTAKTIYDTTADAAAKDKRADRLIIQNNSTVPVKVTLNDTVTPAGYHFILGAASAANAGDGGTHILYPRQDFITKVSAMGVGGAMKLNLIHYVQQSDK